MFGPISATYVILSFHHTCGLTKGLGGARSEPQDAHPPEDVARCEATHASSKMERAQREREREREIKNGAPPVGRQESGEWIRPSDRGPPARGKMRVLVLIKCQFHAPICRVNV
jgi:hypothetical protein